MKWLQPGMQVKRWLGLLCFGIAVLTAGLAYLLRSFYGLGGRLPWPAYYLTLNFLHTPLRGIIVAAIGIVAVTYSIWKLNKALVDPLLSAGDSLVDLVHRSRIIKRGPKVVAIGGGHGLSTLLRGLKEHTANITAIVTVADDGGSSGRLRRDLGMLPPGDARNCILALSDVEPIMAKLMDYRFKDGEGLEGHSFGNLLIAAMSDITGSFEKALEESSRVLNVRGQILPSTLDNVILNAESEDGTVSGESKISTSGKKIKRVFLQPTAKAYPVAVKAICEADMIILGPGSLYTSILPNLCIEGISQAIRESAATKIYVCNVATESGETDGFQVNDHVQALFQHTYKNLFKYVLVNDNLESNNPRNLPVERVSANLNPLQIQGLQIILADVVDEQIPLHHDSKKLAAAVMRIYYDSSLERFLSPGSKKKVAILNGSSLRLPVNQKTEKADGSLVRGGHK